MLRLHPACVLESDKRRTGCGTKDQHGIAEMSAQLAPSTESGLIAQADREIWDRRITARRDRADGDRVRRRVKAIDALVTLLEERHLCGERTFDRVLRQRLHHLEQEVGLPLPRKAVRARNTVRLHAALLDWQETLLDSLLPERLAFPDVHDSDWAAETPVSW
jgi:hypothetical protein